MLILIRLTVLFVFSGVCLPAFAQRDTVFYTKSKQPCSRAQAEIYQLITPLEKAFQVREFDIDGTLRMEGRFNSVAPKEMRDGLSTWYLKTGEKSEEKYYQMGFAQGTDTRYYPNGTIWFEGSFEQDKPIGKHQWYYLQGPLKRYELYTAGKMAEGKCYTLSGADTVYFPAEEMPVFPGNDEALYHFIGKEVNYPKECRKKGIEGKVYVKFKVDSDGRVGDISVLRGVHPLIDAEAMRVVSLLPVWKPGRQEGKPVSVMYTLPIRFKLK